MREHGYSSEDVADWMSEHLRENPKMTADHMIAIYQAESTVAEYAGGRYEGIGADVHDHARQEREKTPNASLEDIYTRAADRLINDIRAYDSAVQEQQKISKSPRVKLS